MCGRLKPAPSGQQCVGDSNLHQVTESFASGAMLRSSSPAHPIVHVHDPPQINKNNKINNKQTRKTIR